MNVNWVEPLVGSCVDGAVNSYMREKMGDRLYKTFVSDVKKSVTKGVKTQLVNDLHESWLRVKKAFYTAVAKEEEVVP